MKKVCESGHSLFWIVGAFLVTAAVSAYIFYWTSLIFHRSSIEKMTETTTTLFQKYQELLPDFVKQKVQFNDPIYLKSYDMVETCEIQPSTLNPQRKVCTQPLGELDFEVQYDEPYLYTYFYMHFTDMHKRQSCIDFLSMKWERVLPSYMWSGFGYIGVVSENGSKMYFSLNNDYINNDGAQKHPDKNHLKEVCKICKKSRYCSVLFFLSLDNQVVQQTLK